MEMTSRAAVALAFAAGPLVLAAGCGGSNANGARQVLVPIQPSSYVTIEPATTTTTTTLAPDAAGGVSPTEQTYTVRAGDSLSKIASLFDITVDVLINYNGWTDGLNHLLLPGDTVLIPPETPIPGAGGQTASDSATDGEAAAPAEESSGDGCQHTIVAGDNPTRVASKYDITIDELAAANATNPAYGNFLIGSQLTIPPGGNC